MEKERCKEQVSGEGRFGGFHRHQCRKSVWKDGYCKVHHPKSIKARDEKAKERWEEKRKNEPISRLLKAYDRIEELEKEVELLKSQLELYCVR